MGANVPKIVDSRYLQALAIPIISVEEVSGGGIGCKAEAFVVSYLCSYVLENSLLLIMAFMYLD